MPMSARAGTGVASLSGCFVPESPAAAAGPGGGSGTAFTGAVFTAAMMTGSSDLGIFIGALAGGAATLAGRVLDHDCRPSVEGKASPAAGDPAITDVPDQPGKTRPVRQQPWRPSQPVYACVWRCGTRSTTNTSTLWAGLSRGTGSRYSNLNGGRYLGTRRRPAAPSRPPSIGWHASPGFVAGRNMRNTRRPRTVART